MDGFNSFDTEYKGIDTSNTPAPDYSPNNIPEPIKRRSTWVRGKNKLIAMREALGQGLEIAGITAFNAERIAQKTQYRQDAVEDFNTQVIQEMTDKDIMSAPEIIAARGGKPTLQARLDEATAQLAQADQNILDINIKMGVDPDDFGAVGDGYSHPLSTRYTTLDEAKVIYKNAESLSDEIDYLAIQLAINYATSLPKKRRVTIKPNKHYYLGSHTVNCPPYTVITSTGEFPMSVTGPRLFFDTAGIAFAYDINLKVDGIYIENRRMGQGTGFKYVGEVSESRGNSLNFMNNNIINFFSALEVNGWSNFISRNRIGLDGATPNSTGITLTGITNDNKIEKNWFLTYSKNNVTSNGRAIVTDALCVGHKIKIYNNDLTGFHTGVLLSGSPTVEVDKNWMELMFYYVRTNVDFTGTLDLHNNHIESYSDNASTNPTIAVILYGGTVTIDDNMIVYYSSVTDRGFNKGIVIAATVQNVVIGYNTIECYDPIKIQINNLAIKNVHSKKKITQTHLLDFSKPDTLTVDVAFAADKTAKLKHQIALSNISSVPFTEFAEVSENLKTDVYINDLVGTYGFMLTSYNTSKAKGITTTLNFDQLANNPINISSKYIHYVLSKGTANYGKMILTVELNDFIYF